MILERSRSEPWRKVGRSGQRARRLVAWFTVLCCLPLSGCGLLWNEFSFLDVQAPPPVTAGDADDPAGS